MNEENRILFSKKFCCNFVTNSSRIAVFLSVKYFYFWFFLIKIFKWFLYEMLCDINGGIIIKEKSFCCWLAGWCWGKFFFFGANKQTVEKKFTFHFFQVNSVFLLLWNSDSSPPYSLFNFTWKKNLQWTKSFVSKC